jgi:hypothetical protein
VCIGIVFSSAELLSLASFFFLCSREENLTFRTKEFENPLVRTKKYLWRKMNHFGARAPENQLIYLFPVF